MAFDYDGGGDERDDRRTILIGAGMALVIIALLVIFVLRIITPDDRLLVVLPDGGTQVSDGDRVRITGTVRDFDFARFAFDAETPADTGGDNALAATSIVPADDVRPTSLAPDDVRNDGDRLGERVTVVGEVGEVVGDDFLTLTDGG